MANRRNQGGFSRYPSPEIGGGVDDEEEGEEELSHGFATLAPPGPSLSREIIMNQPTVTSDHAVDVAPPPSNVLPSYYRPGEMAAIVAALTHVVSGQRAAGTSFSMLPPSPSSSSSPSLPLSSPDYSPASWIGQKRGREEGSSSRVQHIAPPQGYRMSGDPVASSRLAEPPPDLPSGT